MNPVKGRAIDDGFVLTLKPFAAMMDFAEIDAVLEKVGEGTVGEGNAPLYLATLVLRCLVTMPLRSSSATSLLKDFSSR